MRFFLFTDGASRGNPGPAAAGVVLKNQKGEVLAERSQFLGRLTNNEAEYSALLLGLTAAKEFIRDKDSTLICLLDSELVASQIRGLYRVKAPHLKEILVKVKRQERFFPKVVYRYIPREKNTRADALANKALQNR